MKAETRKSYRRSSVTRHSLHATTRVSAILTLILLLAVVSNAVNFVGAQPSAVTLPATDITDTSAVLFGIVTTNGQETLWAFAVVSLPYDPA